jgi:hypothetical protein
VWHHCPSSGSPSSFLQAAKFVYVRALTTLAPLYRGPFCVHKRADKFFIIMVGGKFDAVSVDQLKPHLGGPVMPADPPRRGRPPLNSARHVVAPAPSAAGIGGSS